MNDHTMSMILQTIAITVAIIIGIEAIGIRRILQRIEIDLHATQQEHIEWENENPLDLIGGE